MEAEANSMDKQKEADGTAGVIVNHIREQSRDGRLVRFEELETLLAGAPGNRTDPDQGGPVATEVLLEAALGENDDVVSIVTEAGELRYYSRLHMSEAYAGILARKEGDHLCFIAGIVRENSALYPRPVPVSVFAEQPFGLGEEEVKACLHAMAGDERYADITGTVTSAGTLFLYSTRHLQPDYGATLAEWLDVGQFQNP